TAASSYLARPPRRSSSSTSGASRPRWASRRTATSAISPGVTSTSASMRSTPRATPSSASAPIGSRSPSASTEMGKVSGKKRDTYTPVMQQYLRAKDAYPDAIVLFRLGDFYELFFDDAIKTAEMLDIALTSRGTGPDGEPIPMAGVPHHSVASYIQRLLELGQTVAICEQMADPSRVRGVVPREVVRVITPGLCVDLDALDARAEHFLVSVIAHAGRFGVAALELST